MDVRLGRADWLSERHRDLLIAQPLDMSQDDGRPVPFREGRNDRREPFLVVVALLFALLAPEMRRRPAATSP